MGNRVKMSGIERAKQFMPFAALKGYEKAIKDKQKIIVPKIELSEDDKIQLDRRLQQLELNSIVTVVYFANGEYLSLTGMLSKVDTYSKSLIIVNQKIPIEDIYALE